MTSCSLGFSIIDDNNKNNTNSSKPKIIYKKKGRKEIKH